MPSKNVPIQLIRPLMAQNEMIEGIAINKASRYEFYFRKSL